MVPIQWWTVHVGSEEDSSSLKLPIDGIMLLVLGQVHVDLQPQYSASSPSLALPSVA